MKKLLDFLSSHNYKEININYSLVEVTASKKQLLLKKDNYFFKIIPSDVEAVTLQITLNSEKNNKSAKDMERELKICEKIQSYF